MRPLLVLRPEPAATLAAARALGLEAVAAPLFEVRPIEPTIDCAGHPHPSHPAAPGGPLPSPSREREGGAQRRKGEGDPRVPSEALLLTSANAVRFHPDRLASLHHLPVYAVGPATAAAARAASFIQVIAGEADAAAIVARAAADGVTRLLHLAGREHRAVTHPGVTIERVIVYVADAVDRLPEAARAALARGAVTLLHSPRAAALFARLMDEAALPRGPIAALSPAVAEAAGPGWATITVAFHSTDAALLAAAARLCEEAGDADAVRR